jgi:hypothetical protein
MRLEASRLSIMDPYLYKPTGYRRVSALNPKNVRVFPWTSMRSVRIGGCRAVRYTLLVTRELVPAQTHGLGLLRTHDIGRTLVVDIYEDGTVIDVLVATPPT